MKYLFHLILVAAIFVSCEEDHPVTDTTTPINPMDSMISIDPIDSMITVDPIDSMITIDPVDEVNLEVDGLTFANANIRFDETNDLLVSALEAVEPIKIIAEVDHAKNAASVDLELDNTKVILFGNPNLGTPLMQKNQLAGLDLPQKLLIFESKDNAVNVAYNNVSYLKARHNLGDLEALNTIAGALKNFASQTTAEDLIVNEATVIENEGIIIKPSSNNFEDTYNNLIAAISGNEKLKIVKELDHQANASLVDLDLNPTRLVIFGNPNLGSPLMQVSQTIGIDLPQKMLVWEDENGAVFVAFNAPDYLAKRHSIIKQDDILNTIGNALNSLSEAAVNP